MCRFKSGPARMLVACRGVEAGGCPHRRSQDLWDAGADREGQIPVPDLDVRLCGFESRRQHAIADHAFAMLMLFEVPLHRGRRKHGSAVSLRGAAATGLRHTRPAAHPLS